MSELLDSLTGAFDTTGNVGARDILDSALRDGLPGPRSERWRYTSLRALERRRFVPVDASTLRPAFDAALIAAIPSPRLVFVNGALDEASSDTQALVAGMRVRTRGDALRAPVHASDAIPAVPRGVDDIFARLNGVLATEGVQVDIDPDTHASAALHLVFIGAPDSSDRAWHLRHSIRLSPGASATIVEHQLAADPHRHFGNTVMHVHVATHAALTHVRVQDDAIGSTQITSTDVTLDGDARYTRLDLELGGALARHELKVELRGERAHAHANGVLLGSGSRQLDTRLDVSHIGRDGACDLVWRGLAAGRSRAAFHGGITIHAGADGTRADLSNKNLLLSDTAEIDTQPVLEIHADEVQAAHGATVGQLDANALFYLRSRGLPIDIARALLTNAFCRETLSVIEEPGLRALLDARLSSALDRLGA